MTINNLGIQENFIDSIVNENILVTVYISKKGVPIQCKIKKNDRFTLLLDVNGKSQLIFKSAISSIQKHQN